MRKAYCTTPRYRVLATEWNGKRQRVRVVVRKGKHEGYVVRWTGNCTGCTEYGDYGETHGPSGCDECGYTGKRRQRQWVPFDAEAYDKHIDHVFDRLEQWRDSHRPTPPTPGVNT